MWNKDWLNWEPNNRFNVDLIQMEQLSKRIQGYYKKAVAYVDEHPWAPAIAARNAGSCEAACCSFSPIESRGYDTAVYNYWLSVHPVVSIPRKNFILPQAQIRDSWNWFAECFMGKRFVKNLTKKRSSGTWLFQEQITDNELFQVAFVQHLPICCYSPMEHRNHSIKFYKYILIDDHLYEFYKYDGAAQHLYFKQSVNAKVI